MNVKTALLTRVTANDASKTAKITNRWYYLAAHWHLGWCCHAWTVATRRSPVYLATSSTDERSSVMNAAARLVCSARKYEHITPLLCDLHWLRLPERIEFKLYVLVFRCLHCTALPYLASELCHVADMDTRKRLRSSSTSALVTPSSCFLCRCAACLEHFAIQRHCVWDTPHLQASSENASFCHVIPLIFPNCAHGILFCFFDFEKCSWSNLYATYDTLIIFV